MMTNGMWSTPSNIIILGKINHILLAFDISLAEKTHLRNLKTLFKFHYHWSWFLWQSSGDGLTAIRWVVAVAKSFFISLMRCCRNQKWAINSHPEKRILQFARQGSYGHVVNPCLASFHTIAS
jgi:hypothetical protein